MKPNQINEISSLHTMRVTIILAGALVLGICAAASLIASVLHP